MASRIDNFRLVTAGGIPYALMEGYPQFKFTADDATATEKYIIAAENLAAFIDECFPEPTVLYGIILASNKRRLPGNEVMITREVSVEPVDMTKPIDPYGIDPNAPPGTYGDKIYVTCNYTTAGNEDDDDQDPQNPETFLTRSANVGGEFLALNAPNVKWKAQVKKDNAAGDAVLAGVSEHPEMMDPLNLPGAVPEGADDAVDGAIEPNKDFQLPITKILPTIEWTLSWKEVIAPPWQQIRELLGKVNDRQLPLFFNAPKDTTLFLGVAAKQEFTARRGVSFIFRKPWSIDFKFTEKHGKDDGVVIGWNHFWRPEKNRFDILLRQPGNKKAYEAGNFARLFQRGFEV